MINRKTPEEIEQMAASGAILARCLQLVRSKARPGVTTGDLDEAAERFIRSQGGEPAFKGYRGFPGSICASPNSMIVHGIPGSYKLQRGDILSIDVGVVLDGWVSDAAITVPIGPVSPIATNLMQTTRDALFDAVEQARPGNHLGDISHAVQNRVEEAGFSVVRALVGHGVGRVPARRREPSLTVAAVNVVCQHWLETPSAITSCAVTGRIRGSAGVWRFAPLAVA